MKFPFWEWGWDDVVHFVAGVVRGKWVMGMTILCFGCNSSPKLLHQLCINPLSQGRGGRVLLMCRTTPLRPMASMPRAVAGWHWDLKNRVLWQTYTATADQILVGSSLARQHFSMLLTTLHSKSQIVLLVFLLEGNIDSVDSPVIPPCSECIV